MAKNIRWQIPFVSLQNIHYRVDIYDEGTFTPVELTAGPTPFVTDEDASDDFFHPVRSQSGTLQVCTLKPDGTYITLDELLPANNIDRPVRLINTDFSEIEWQGFLSCEAYSQDYTGIPQIIDLPLISVLEAMDSIELEVNSNIGFHTFLFHILNTLQTVQTNSGMTLFDKIYIDDYFWDAILKKYIYGDVFLSEEKVVNGPYVKIEVHSISLKEVLEKIAKYFGGCWRECGRDLYLCLCGDSDKYHFMDFSTLYDFYVTMESTAILDITLIQTFYRHNISSLQWMGTDHQKSVRQGMRRLTVVANMKNPSFSLGLPEVPATNLHVNPSDRRQTWGEIYAFGIADAFSNVSVQSIYTRLYIYQDGSDAGKSVTISADSVQSYLSYARTIFWMTSEFRANYDRLVGKNYNTNPTLVGTTYDYMSAFFTKLKFPDASLHDGVMIYGLPSYFPTFAFAINCNWFDFNENNYVLKIESPITSVFLDGQLNLTIDIGAAEYNNRILFNGNQDGHTQHIGHTLFLALSIGDKWLHNTNGVWSWESSFATFALSAGYNNYEPLWSIQATIPINTQLQGNAKLYVYPRVGGWESDFLEAFTVLGLFVENINLSYENPLRQQSGSNIYTQDTDKEFRDTERTDVDFAIDVTGTGLVSVLWDSVGTPATSAQLNGEDVIPEKDLLNRMTTYYSEARTILELKAYKDVKPTDVFVGLNDDRIYKMLSLSRDWHTLDDKMEFIEIMRTLPQAAPQTHNSNVQFEDKESVFDEETISSES